MSLTTVDSGLISSGAITLTTQVTGTLPEANGGTGTTVGYYGMKNRIINGAMVIDQRNSGASGTASAFMVDRFSYYATQATKATWQQNAGAITPPVGFSNYLGATSSSAYSITASDQFLIGQRIEGFNFSDMAWGTANAASVTLSFRVYSSLTGTFGGSMQNSASNRCYPFSYSIPVANTWTTISITIAGDTTGTWVGGTNGTGAILNFSLGSGSTYSATAGAWTATSYITSATGATSVVGTNGATFYITGVQLEKGSTATSFDYRPYGTELALCQRYYWKSYNSSVVLGSNTAAGGQAGAVMIYIPATGNTVRCTMPYKVNMRAAPTVTLYNPETGTAGFGAYEGSGATNQVALQATFISDYSVLIFATAAGFTGSFYWQASATAEL